MKLALPRNVMKALSGAIMVSALPISIAVSTKDAPSPDDRPAPPPRTPAQTDVHDYSWPIDSHRRITSTFAEYRSTHFHGGIDIGTGSRTGFKVLAARDGFVEKIQVSPTGYGKILFVRHADDFVTTYAHLERFNDVIETRVREEQMRRERYPVFIQCSPGQFPVRKGEVIAYSGQTGVGTPHLHFEIRDPEGQFVNPFLCPDISGIDNIRPSIRRISVAPLGEQTIVNGEWTFKVFKAYPSSAGKFFIKEKIHITGKAGLGIDVRDMTDGSYFRHGVYKNELFIDGKLMFRAQLDRAPAEDGHHIGLYYEPRQWRGRRQGRLERLYVDSPNNLRFYQPQGATSGIVESSAFTEGPHSFSIVSSDYHGNSSEVNGTLVFNHPPAVEALPESSFIRLSFHDITSIRRVTATARRVSDQRWTTIVKSPERSMDGNQLTLPLHPGEYDLLKVVAENKWGTRSEPVLRILQETRQGGGGTMHLQRMVEADFVRLLINASGMFTSPPRVVVVEGASSREFQTHARDFNSYVVAFRPLETFAGPRQIRVTASVDGHPVQAVDEVTLYPIVAGTSDTLSVDQDRLRIVYGPTTALKTFFLSADPFGHGSSRGYDLSPTGTILGDELRFQLSVESFHRGFGVFVGDKLDATIDSLSSPWIEATASEKLTDITLRPDNSPPYISRLRISNLSRRRPHITFHVGDDASGVEYNEVKTYIDDGFVIPEIDGEHRRVTYSAREPLPPGTHVLVIRAKDRMDNATELKRFFTIR